MSQVTVVCEGFLRKEAGAVLEAHSTATLVTSGSFLVLVDTSSQGYRARLVGGLEALDISPREIDMVVNTHLHADHCGNNDLFPQAIKLARVEEDPGAGFDAVTSEMDLRPGIRLIHTPGHTRGSMSMVVDAEDGRYVIAGDAVPTKDNFDRFLAPMIRYDEEVALNSMRRIAGEAEFIVPGHGAPFIVERVFKR